jgi:hypothetical protein
LDFDVSPGAIQPDQCLPGANDVAVRNQNFPDDASLQMLNCLSARFCFDHPDSNGGTLERCEG